VEGSILVVAVTAQDMEVVVEVYLVLHPDLLVDCLVVKTNTASPVTVVVVVVVPAV